jgi:hypothetical protein
MAYADEWEDKTKEKIQRKASLKVFRRQRAHSSDAV